MSNIRRYLLRYATLDGHLTGALALDITTGSDLALIASSQLLRIKTEYLYPDLQDLYSSMYSTGSHFDVRAAWNYLHTKKIPIPSDRLISDWYTMYDIMMEHYRQNNKESDKNFLFRYDLERIINLA